MADLIWMASGLLVIGLIILFVFNYILLTQLNRISEEVIRVHEKMNGIYGRINSLEKSMGAYKTFRS